MKLLTLLLLCFAHIPQVIAKITPQQIAIIINTEDGNSTLIADYYQHKRNIPEENLIKITTHFTFFQKK